MPLLLKSFTASLVLAIVMTTGGNAFAASIDLMTAGKYNTFIFNNFSGSSDTQGSLAVGGNATLHSYSVGDQLNSGYTGDSLVVGGNLNYSDGRVYYGNISVGGNANVSSSVTNGLSSSQSLSQGVSNLSVDFASEEKYLKNLSSELSGMVSTGTSGILWGGVQVKGNGSSDLQIFNLDGNDLSKSTWWHTLSGIPDDATIILNISGKNAKLSGGQQVLAGLSNRVLFNFYEAVNLEISGISVEGSILAPYATISNAQGVIQGNVIAKNLSGSIQQNLNPFQGYGGDTPGGETPEPATLLLLGSGMGLFVAGRSIRRRSKV